jgi:hypothetical protein
MPTSSYGLPSATKRQIEDAAVNAMGENKNTDMIKDALRKIPDSDHSNLGDVKDNVNSGATGEHQTPLGDTVRQRQDSMFKKMAWDFSRPGRRLRLTGVSQAREIADRATAPGKVREAATGPVVI